MTVSRPVVITAWIVVAVVLIGIGNGTWVAGGMDSYGYISQSDRWLRGDVVVDEPAADVLPWPNAIETLTPIGYLPGPDRRSSVPYYAPGLSILMAIAQWAGGHCAVFWVVPLTGGLLVASTFAIGRRLRSDAVGLAAAALVAMSPAVLFMLTAPMSDVPAAAFWALAIALVVSGSTRSPWRSLAGGLSASIAVLIRPNLVPIAALIALWLVVEGVLERRSSLGRRLAPAASFAVGLLPGCLAIAWLNARWFGSPLKSGPGSLDYLFQIDNLAANLTRYPRWIVETQTPLVLLAIVAILLPLRNIWRTSFAQRVAVLFGAIFLTVLVMHSLFVPLEEWWYLRYLLAAWPGLFVALAIVLARLWEAERLWPRLVGVSVVSVLCFFGLGVAARRGAFTNASGERRYVDAARLLQQRTGTDAVILSAQHSGTVRYYGGRLTVRYDWIESAWLDRAVAWLDGRKRHVYALLEEWERPLFEERFAGQNAAAPLRGNPVFVYRTAGGPAVYFYDLKAPENASKSDVIEPESTAARCDAPMQTYTPLR